VFCPVFDVKISFYRKGTFAHICRILISFSICLLNASKSNFGRHSDRHVRRTFTSARRTSVMLAYLSNHTATASHATTAATAHKGDRSASMLDAQNAQSRLKMMSKDFILL
jgi:hypothetical protein